MSHLPKIIEECIIREIPVEIEWNTLHLCPQYMIAGFSKAGDAQLIFNEDGTATARTRYQRVDDIANFEELAELAHEWWMDSCNVTWPHPPNVWADALKELNIFPRK